MQQYRTSLTVSVQTSDAKRITGKGRRNKEYKKQIH